LPANWDFQNSMSKNEPIPPRLATQLLRIFLRDDLQEDVIGDLEEAYECDVQARGTFSAKVKYWRQVLNYLRPFAIKRFKASTSNPTDMYKSYFRTAIQNMVKNKLHAFINIAGLAIGMAVALIIGLWIYDEVSFNKRFANHDRIGQVIQNVTNNGQVDTWRNIPWPLGDELRQNYGSHFEYLSMSSDVYERTIAIGDEKYSRTGLYVEPDFHAMFGVELVSGTFDKSDLSGVLLSSSAALAFFGSADPIGKSIEMDGTSLKISGVYRDFPEHSRWDGIQFLAQWDRFKILEELEQMPEPWRPNGFLLFVMLADHATFETASLGIKDAKLKKLNEVLAKKKPELFLHSMGDWHLRSEFNSGKQTGGLITYVWMFGIVGAFVLLMACINFMNLSTARSEKRAKEVGIRKAVGSYRGQLITQFFSESVLTAFISLVLAAGLTHLTLPLFNSMAEKNMSLPWTSPYMWIGIVAGSIVIGLIAGSYPALYLSAIRPAGALKGVHKAGRGASLPRKVLVIVQFSVSVIMIIGTTTVFLQIQHGRNRPLGYNLNGLVSIPRST
jgi:putative ABC transport system permease protein